MCDLMEFYPFQEEYMFYQLELLDAMEEVSTTRAPRGLRLSSPIAVVFKMDKPVDTPEGTLRALVAS
ncbi:hypothetical protein N7481_012123 [Penicillium waksmanii]|uniref:uncharacterized protein n=1 Tax=Penicillium waksmanii TaxID=69791 RepID=UPI0025465CBF|nr:uncharacterized protein N7481_012123 [Penicillium waksmanii]KAJ5965409.1 hypothetical protein N7481_012123 [Penicillium waksmanii]